MGLLLRLPRVPHRSARSVGRIAMPAVAALAAGLGLAALTHSAGAADLPDIDMEDDSSYAWAVFRQKFADGRMHAIALFAAAAVVLNRTPLRRWSQRSAEG